MVKSNGQFHTNQYKMHRSVEDIKRKKQYKITSTTSLIVYILNNVIHRSHNTSMDSDSQRRCDSYSDDYNQCIDCTNSHSHSPCPSANHRVCFLQFRVPASHK